MHALQVPRMRNARVTYASVIQSVSTHFAININSLLIFYLNLMLCIIKHSISDCFSPEFNKSAIDQRDGEEIEHRIRMFGAEQKQTTVTTVAAIWHFIGSELHFDDEFPVSASERRQCQVSGPRKLRMTNRYFCSHKYEGYFVFNVNLGLYN